MRTLRMRDKVESLYGGRSRDDTCDRGLVQKAAEAKTPHELSWKIKRRVTIGVARFG